MLTIFLNISIYMKKSKKVAKSNELPALDSLKSVDIQTEYFKYWKKHLVTAHFKDGTYNTFEVANPNAFL